MRMKIAIALPRQFLTHVQELTPLFDLPDQVRALCDFLTTFPYHRKTPQQVWFWVFQHSHLLHFDCQDLNCDNICWILVSR